MKKIYILGIILAAFASCSDFIEEENLSGESADSFYITPDGFNSLVNANYEKLRDIYGDSPFLFEGGTDLISKGRGQGPLGLTEYRDLNSTSDGVDHLYNECYAAIQLANRAIYYSEITEQTAQLPTLVSEVKFLRALSYFLLVQSYGGVAITDYIDSPILEFDRNTAEEVYAQIISDLEDAIAGAGTGAYVGRVNKRAARNLLAKVYLTRGYESFGSQNDFTTAAALADEVIGGEALNLPFSEVFRPGNDLNEEVIFSVQFDAASISADPDGLGSRQYAYFGSYLGGSEVQGQAPARDYSSSPTDFAISLFTEDDARWEGTFMTEIFYIDTDDYTGPSYFTYYRVPEEEHNSLTVIEFYEPQWFTPEDKANYLATKNLAPSFKYHNYGEYSSEWTDTVSLDYEVICVKKFDDPSPTTAFGGRSSTRDIILSRLAETYLVAAEAYLQAGQASTGLLRLNAVRNRAGVADATIGEFDIDYILDERARELFGEYHRWFDLKRTGKLVERTSLYNNQVNESDFNGAGALKILRPIPQQALDLNQNNDFPQNPAYN
ncbi:RagB/SusD family nutrient uptake outer membrane protein [Maribacter sp. MAR_2009_72]|uniref:RagB/SusD family nutrient uptake outer membrane protein n=1 Tax=Maribacter sp. MAR_2009_72 TaxID=1250050 RepID=UPI00119ABBB3|nr:RagB/SusD family nutrient uptake outer membrane protein [Maribacter sp. MAR_2009_72]TVZ17079.1 putative outer membrane starch-binding protein [Maribacter sp. MAR_2009_72]